MVFARRLCLITHQLLLTGLSNILFQFCVVGDHLNNVFLVFFEG